MQCGIDPVDVLVRNEGSIVMFQPLSQLARDWFDANVESDAWQWFGVWLCVDHRPAETLLDGLTGEGFTIQEG